MKATLNDTNWYVCYTYPKHEKKVKAQVDDRKIEAFLPLVRTIRRWSDRTRKIDLPLFPNYVFVKTDLRNLLMLLNIEGLSRFISFGNEYATVREEEIKAIQRLIDNKYGIPVQVEGTSFRRGQKVRIISGPFDGLEGEVVSVRGKTKLVVNIDSIGQGLSVELPSGWLREKI